jgi:SP family general alpha glucoside:H+ symporter-like MFS transporter
LDSLLTLVSSFFWAGICFCCIIYTYFRVPEPRGRTFAELDLLFEQGVSARKFATTNVDVFDETVEGSVIAEYERKQSVVYAENEKSYQG